MEEVDRSGRVLRSEGESKGPLLCTRHLGGRLGPDGPETSMSTLTLCDSEFGRTGSVVEDRGGRNLTGSVRVVAAVDTHDLRTTHGLRKTEEMGVIG